MQQFNFILCGLVVFFFPLVYICKYLLRSNNQRFNQTAVSRQMQTHPPTQSQSKRQTKRYTHAHRYSCTQTWIHGWSYGVSLAKLIKVKWRYTKLNRVSPTNPAFS